MTEILKSLIFAKALREKRGNLLEKERGIAETLSEQITSNDVNKDLADKSLDILKSLQMGNLDVNELKNFFNYCLVFILSQVIRILPRK